jgi:hypothetical protein
MEASEVIPYIKYLDDGDLELVEFGLAVVDKLIEVDNVVKAEEKLQAIFNMILDKTKRIRLDETNAV